MTAASLCGTWAVAGVTTEFSSASCKPTARLQVNVCSGLRSGQFWGQALEVPPRSGTMQARQHGRDFRAALAADEGVKESANLKTGLRGKFNKVVLAYSGGLDTSVIVPWLRENYGCEVVCFTADVGQGVGETDGLEAKAKASGASQLVIHDLKEEFVKDFIYPCLRAGAVYERKYLLGTSMGSDKPSKIGPTSGHSAMSKLGLSSEQIASAGWTGSARKLSIKSLLMGAAASTAVKACKDRGSHCQK